MQYINTAKKSIDSELIKIGKCSTSKRIKLLELAGEGIFKFLEDSNKITTRDLEFIPYYRFLLAENLNDAFNGALQKTILAVLNDYESGALFVSIGDYTTTKEHYLKFSTAISDLIGLPNIDLLSGKYYATFTIENTEDAPINLLQPYENFKMHTDGAFMQESTDWVLFMKMFEENVVGGETKLLHIEDWKDFSFFYDHSLGSNELKFAGPMPSDKRAENWGNHRKFDALYSSVLSKKNGRKSIRFVDQFIHPGSMKEAKYISEIQESLEKSNNLLEIELPVGSLLVVNNQSWIHGRNKFQANRQLKRELMRQRGIFGSLAGE